MEYGVILENVQNFGFLGMAVLFFVFWQKDSDKWREIIKNNTKALEEIRTTIKVLLGKDD